MRQKPEARGESAGKTVRDIRPATRRRYSVEDKILIVISGLRGEDSIAELCRQEGIGQNLHCRWSKELLEAGKRRLDQNLVPLLHKTWLRNWGPVTRRGPANAR